MKVLSCYSIKGGVGKTALAVNLSCHLQQTGHRTLLMDLDPQGAAAFYYRVAAAKESPDDDSEELSGAWVRKNLRESDFPGLDILPSNLAFRNLDVQLADMKKPRRQLAWLIKELRADYDALVIDCPPNITLLSENVFRASDAILVPVIPTTLSARTLTQLEEFFQAEGLETGRIFPFFSMVQYVKRLHLDLMVELRSLFPKFLQHEIPFSVDVETMGVHRTPLLHGAPDRPAALAYRGLCEEILSRCPATE